MVEYKTIFFWLGGVLTDPIYKLTSSLLAPGVKGLDVVGIWDALRVCADNLALGKLTPIDYCTQAAEITGSSLAAPEVELRLLEAVKLRQEVISLIGEIPEKYECRLISDLPSQWLQGVLDAYTPGIPFPDFPVDYTSHLNLNQLTPDIYYSLLTSENRRIEECLIVDGVSHRAVEAVKNDFSCIIYVYPDRLKHELALQEIMVAEREVLHPQSSERVEIK